MIRGVNHITLAVRDLDRATDFYQNILGLSLRKRFKTGAYLEAGSTWICLSFDENARSKPCADYTHLAFDIAAEDFNAMKDKLVHAGVHQWKDNKSEGESYYFLDPDGHKLEIHVGNLQTRLAYMEEHRA